MKLGRGSYKSGCLLPIDCARASVVYWKVLGIGEARQDVGDSLGPVLVTPGLESGAV